MLEKTGSEELQPMQTKLQMLVSTLSSIRSLYNGRGTLEHFKQYHVSQTSQDTAAKPAVILVLQPAQSVDDLSTELCFTLLGGILVDVSGYCLYVYSDSHNDVSKNEM